MQMFLFINNYNMNNTYEYTIRDYPSNVEVFVRILDEEGENTGRGGRCAMITCTGDEPQYKNEEDWENGENAMTRGSELGAFLRGVTSEELADWLAQNGHNTGREF